jgi:hypothetical protein
MRNTMVDLLLVLLKIPMSSGSRQSTKVTYTSVRLGDTLRYNLLVALLVTCIATIFALIPHGVQQEIAAEGT